jgi:antitoxin VapB
MLNIKNPKAHELAVQVAARTGETLTDAVIHALEERLQRTLKPVHKKASMEELMATVEEIRRHLPPEFFAEEDPSAFLYDPETGLPA